MRATLHMPLPAVLLTSQVINATWLVSAHGIVESSINGTLVSGDVLTPGWSSYEWRLRYRAYDVTTLIRTAGERVVLGLALGNGWFRGRLGWTGRGNFYGTNLCAVAGVEMGTAGED